MDFTDFLVSHNSSLDVNGVSLLQNKQSQILPRNCFSITSFLNIVYEDSKYLLLYQGLSGVAPILSAQHILIRGRSRLLFTATCTLVLCRNLIAAHYDGD